MKRLDTVQLHTIICNTLEEALKPDTLVPNKDGYVTVYDLQESIRDWIDENLPLNEGLKVETEYNVTELIMKGINPWMEGYPDQIQRRKAGRVFAYKGYPGLGVQYLQARKLNDTSAIKEEAFEFIKGSLNFSLMAAIRNRINIVVDEAVQQAERQAGGKLGRNKRDAVIAAAKPKGPFICYEDSEFEFTDDYEPKSLRERQILLAFADAIIRRIPVSVSYKPVNRLNAYDIEFHPHYIRWVGHKLMVYGESRKTGSSGDYRLVNLILRRVQGMAGIDGVEYVGPEKRGIDYNRGFFRNSMTFNAQLDRDDRNSLTRVVLKVRKAKQALVGGRILRPYDRILTEPLHHSQDICPDYPETEEFGYLSLKVNDAMFVKPILLAYGGDLEVIEPLELRQLMAEEIKIMAGLYANDGKA